MKAAKRGPAHFVLKGKSSIKGLADYEWRVTVTTNGVTAKRTRDNVEVSIDWRTLLGVAMFHGHDRVDAVLTVEPARCASCGSARVGRA